MYTKKLYTKSGVTVEMEGGGEREGYEPDHQWQVMVTAVRMGNLIKTLTGKDFQSALPTACYFVSTLD